MQPRVGLTFVYAPTSRFIIAVLTEPEKRSTRRARVRRRGDRLNALRRLGAAIYRQIDVTAVRRSRKIDERDIDYSNPRLPIDLRVRRGDRPNTDRSYRFASTRTSPGSSTTCRFRCSMLAERSAGFFTSPRSQRRLKVKNAACAACNEYATAPALGLTVRSWLFATAAISTAAVAARSRRLRHPLTSNASRQQTAPAPTALSPRRRGRASSRFDVVPSPLPPMSQYSFLAPPPARWTSWRSAIIRPVPLLRGDAPVVLAAAGARARDGRGPSAALR